MRTAGRLIYASALSLHAHMSSEAERSQSSHVVDRMALHFSLGTFMSAFSAVLHYHVSTVAVFSRT